MRRAPALSTIVATLAVGAAFPLVACLQDFDTFTPTGEDPAPAGGRTDGGSTTDGGVRSDASTTTDAGVPNACTAVQRCFSTRVSCAATCETVRQQCSDACSSGRCRSECRDAADRCSDACTSACRQCAGDTCAASCD